MWVERTSHFVATCFVLCRKVALFPVGGRLRFSTSVPSAITSYLLQLLHTIFDLPQFTRQLVAVLILQLVFESSKYLARLVQVRLGHHDVILALRAFLPHPHSFVLPTRKGMATEQDLEQSEFCSSSTFA